MNQKQSFVETPILFVVHKFSRKNLDDFVYESEQYSKVYGNEEESQIKVVARSFREGFGCKISDHTLLNESVYPKDSGFAILFFITIQVSHEMG